MLKNLKLSIALLFISTGLFAQSYTSPYVFPEFARATILQKSGASLEADLDYNTITQEMMFVQDGKKMVLDQAAIIDTIYFQTRRFIPAKGVFFEKLTNTAVPLYAQYINKAVKAANQEAERRVVSEIYKKGNVAQVEPYDLKLADGYKLQNESLYWLKKGADFIPVKDVKKLASAFPGRQAQIDEFIKQNNINLHKQDDLIKLVEFCNK